MTKVVPPGGPQRGLVIAAALSRRLAPRVTKAPDRHVFPDELRPHQVWHVRVDMNVRAGMAESEKEFLTLTAPLPEGWKEDPVSPVQMLRTRLKYGDPDLYDPEDLWDNFEYLRSILITKKDWVHINKKHRGNPVQYEHNVFQY